MRRFRKRNNYHQKKSLHIGRLFPNLITILALCLGFSSIRFALNERWEISVSLILIAAVLDGMDGRIARLLNSTSNFGAQLDSLSDLVNFGIAPALFFYLWKGHELQGVGWAVTLFFVTCAAVRLARFNSELDDRKSPDWHDKFFVGVPSPAGAVLCLTPVMISFGLNEKNIGGELFFTSPEFLCVYTAMVAVLMASRVPTFSIKKLTISRPEFIIPFITMITFLMIAVIVEPWLVLPFLGGIYIISIFFSIMLFFRLKKIKNLRKEC